MLNLANPDQLRQKRLHAELNLLLFLENFVNLGCYMTHAVWGENTIRADSKHVLAVLPPALPSKHVHLS